MSYETIAYDLNPRGIATIALDRPDKGNAFNQVMLNELMERFSALGNEVDARAIVLRARGKHFCVGADLGGDKDRSDASIELFDVLEAIDTSPLPTIAIVQGGCVGAGLAFAACCDVIVAAEDAFFSIPEVRIGFVPILAPLFIRAIGYRAFRRYGLLGERFSAERASRLGLVHEVCSEARIEETLAGLVDAALLGAPQAQRALKSMAARHAMPGLTEIFPPRAERPKLDNRSPEALEGVAAFREKRKPGWYRA